MIERGYGNHLMALQTQLRSKVKYELYNLDNQSLLPKMFHIKLLNKS